MATATHIPVSEYLKTTYRPNCDYIDGEVRKRSVGERPHGHMQAILSAIFMNNRAAWAVRPMGDTRVQITSDHYRISDPMLLRKTDRKGEIIAFAPLLCIEILSHEVWGEGGYSSLAASLAK